MSSHVQSFRSALRGIIHGLKSQRHLRFHACAAILVVILGFTVGINRIEWDLTASAIAAVSVAELLNSSVEQIANAVSTEWNETIRNAKDLAAGAVLLAAIYAVVVGATVFLPRLTALGGT